MDLFHTVLKLFISFLSPYQWPTLITSWSTVSRCTKAFKSRLLIHIIIIILHLTRCTVLTRLRSAWIKFCYQWWNIDSDKEIRLTHNLLTTISMESRLTFAVVSVFLPHKNASSVVFAGVFRDTCISDIGFWNQKELIGNDKEWVTVDVTDDLLHLELVIVVPGLFGWKSDNLKFRWTSSLSRPGSSLIWVKPSPYREVQAPVIQPAGPSLDRLV